MNYKWLVKIMLLFRKMSPLFAFYNALSVLDQILQCRSWSTIIICLNWKRKKIYKKLAVAVKEAIHVVDIYI